MPTFTAPALDRLIESSDTRSVALLRNSFDSEIQTRTGTGNPRFDKSMNGNNSKLDMRVSSLPPNPNPVRGVSVPQKPNPERDASLPLSQNPEKGVTRKHERGHSLPSAPNLERDCSIPPISKLDRGVSLPLNPKLERAIPVPYRTNGSSASVATAVERRDHWTGISPALYATPESTPLPDSPSSFSPSPYIVNHKGRGPRLLKSFLEEDVSSRKQCSDTINLQENGNVPHGGSSKPAEALDCGTNGVYDGSNDNEAGSEQNGAMKSVEYELPQDSDVDDFLDPQDSMSVRSIGENEGYPGAERNLNPSTPIAEFYDAWEELSSDSGYQLSTPRTENELRGMRTSLLMEIEKRKQAEETLSIMTDQWRRIRDQLSDVGIRLPESLSTYSPSEQPDDPIADVCQQVFVSRIVSESIGRGLARAEVEMEKEAQISMKNTEIVRLCDKLRYYEAVNREMSQRNQEIVETTRRLRQRRKRRQKWIWGSIATAVTLATASLAYSYFQAVRTSTSSGESPSEQNPKE